MADIEINVFLQDAILRGLYERSGIFNLLPDYSYLIKGKWADSVDFPKNPQIYVGEGAVTKASGNRTKIKASMTKKNVAFAIYTCAITEEAEANVMSNGEMADRVIADAVDALGDKLDAAVCTKFATGIPDAQKIDFIGSEVSWKDLITGSAKARALKIGASNLLYLIPPALEPEVKDIDVIKLAMSNNANYFEGGIAKVDGNYYSFTSMVPQIGGKDAILIVNLRFTGRATKESMKRVEVYDQDTQETAIDYLTYTAFDKLRDESVVALIKA